MDIRIGFGYDVHPLKDGTELILGGIKIKHHKTAVGHSDADVLIHAICDALLGAVNLGDIGTHFPPSNSKFKGIDSTIFLMKVVQMLSENNYSVGNIDTTVVLQEPKIKDFVPEMQKVISAILKVDTSKVSVKATTTEQLGFTGREEGVAAYASVLVHRF